MIPFIDRLPHSGDPFPSEWQILAAYEAALRRRRKETGTAPATVEAVMHQLRTDGIAALKSASCQHRLAELSPAQVAEVIERLERLRPNHTAISDELLCALAELRR